MDKRWRNHEGKCLHQPSFFAGQIESLSSNKLGKESVISLVISVWQAVSDLASSATSMALTEAT